MTYPAVFAAGAGHPFSDEFQDMIREHMIARLPRAPEPKPERKPYTLGDDSFARRRAKISPYAVSMRDEGMSIHAISQQFGVSHNTIRRILKEAEYQAPQRDEPTLQAPQHLCGRITRFYEHRTQERAKWVAKQAEAGYTTSQIAQALSVSKSAVVRIVGKGKEAV